METIEGRGLAPRLVLPLVQRLPDTSMTTALANGGREQFGWGQDRHLAADLFDALMANTRATGNWGKKPPKIAPYPRPKNKQKPQKKKGQSVKDIFSMFGRKGTGR